jgi:hypothetical protein
MSSAKFTFKHVKQLRQKLLLRMHDIYIYIYHRNVVTRERFSFLGLTTKNLAIASLYMMAIVSRYKFISIYIYISHASHIYISAKHVWWGELSSPWDHLKKSYTRRISSMVHIN